MRQLVAKDVLLYMSRVISLLIILLTIIVVVIVLVVIKATYTRRSSASISSYFGSDRNKSQPLLAGR